MRQDVFFQPDSSWTVPEVLPQFAPGKQKTNLIDSLKHCVLKSGHPSPLSANRGFWFGNKHFSKCNSYLKEVGKNEINWSLD